MDALFQPHVLEGTVMICNEYSDELKTMNAALLDEQDIKAFKQTSAEFLSDPGNALHLLNILEQRTFVSGSHANKYQKILEGTHDLIADIEHELTAS